MKNKVLKLGIIICILASILVPVIISYATETENTETNEYFYSEVTSACPGDIVEMKLNISNIESESFTFSLESNLEEVNLEDVTSNENIEGTIENNILKIDVNKTENNIEQLSLFYKIPETMKIGTKIKLKGTIEIVKESNTEEIEESIEIEVVGKVSGDTPSITPDIGDNVGKVETENENNDKEQNMPTTNSNKNNNTQSMTTNTQSLENGGMQTETVTYNGSNNNYLKKLSISGYDINPTFIKTTNTYFINVDDDVDSVKVKAEAESSSATINIYGNTSLDKKENKVLISVTAKNGDVRTYRIYVIKDEV